MTQDTDLDRLLGDWLSDGPNRAPDQPVNAASQFARAHPRRPDPLRIFRSDPMADLRPRILGLRPAMVFALLGLVLAIVGVAVIGSRRDDPSVMPPAPLQPTASPQPSALTAGPPSPAGSPAVTPTHVTLQSEIGNRASVDVVDESGLLIDAASGPGIARNDQIAFDVTNDAPTVVRLTWSGAVCDTVHRLTIDPTVKFMTLERPFCLGDAMGVIRVLILTFSQPVDAAGLNTEERPGQGGVDMPNWTLSAIDSAGQQYDLSLYDARYSVDTIEAADVTDVADPGSSRIRLDQVDPTTVRIVWSGQACETAPRLTIDASGTTGRLLTDPCTSGGPDVVRAVDLHFTASRNATSLFVEAPSASPRPS